METIKPDDLLTIRQASELVKVHPNTIRNLMLRGELEAFRIGSRIIRIPKANVEALLTRFQGGEFGVWKR